MDTCDSDEALFLEGYWIQQFQTWGFNLFNKYKKIGIRPLSFSTIKKEKSSCSVRVRYVKKTPEQWAAERQTRLEEKRLQKQLRKANKVNKWNKGSFEVGRVYEVPIKRKNSFREMLRASAKSLGLERHFPYIINGDNITFTVQEGKRVYLPHYGKTKKGAIRYSPLKPKKEKTARPKKFKYGFDKVQFGDVAEIDILKWDSFRNSIMQYNNLHKLCIRYSYRPNENFTKVIVTFLNPDTEIVNIPIPYKYVRPNAWLKKPRTTKSKISQEKAIEITKRFINGEKAADLKKECPELKSVSCLYKVFKRIKQQSA